MKFKSKADWWLTVLLWAPIGITWGMLVQDPDWLFFLVNVLLTGFIGMFWFGTYYVIDRETLIVSFGVGRKKIPIASITSLRKSSSLVSSAAMSLDRIEINYRETEIFSDTVYVSPKDKVLFVQMLVERNEKIVLDDKLASFIHKS